MGQFLAIGLAIKISVAKRDVNKAQLNMEELQEVMRQEIHYIPEIYVVSADDDSYCFTLKKDILYDQLIPFLKSIYPLLYDDPVFYNSIISRLGETPPSGWLEWAAEKPGEAFQFEEYGTCDSVERNYTRISVCYDCLLLSMEGKIMMEVFGRQFKFFKYTMMQTFRQFAIAGALRTYITG